MITVAIPFYNTVDYLEPLLEEIVDSFIVYKIVKSNDDSDYSFYIVNSELLVHQTIGFIF